jgi:methionyl-tRNA synthetase
VFGDDAVNSGIPSDVWRYYLLANRPEQADTMFAWEDFMEKNNNELLANLGNLVNRTLVFLKNNFEGSVPSGQFSPSDEKFLAEQKAVFATITDDFEKVKLKDALHKTMSYSKNANKYFQDNKPWELVKKDKARAGAVMGVLACQIRDLTILISPFLPATSKEICLQMNLQPGRWEDVGKPIPAGHQLGEPKTVFRRIEKKEIEDLRAKFAGKKKDAELEKPLSFVDLDLEVGQILSVEKHPDAEKLFVEKVQLGDGVRQIVSGLVGHYLPEELVGKKVVILRNMASAKLRGVESQGMLLAAEGREYAPSHEGKTALEQGAVEVIFCQKSEVGEKIQRKGEPSAPKRTITINEFRKIKIDVKGFEIH